MTAPSDSDLTNWLSRLRAVTLSVESKKALAAHLGVTLPAVYHYLASGKKINTPSVSTLMRLLAWVGEQEAKQQKTLAGATNTSKGRKARKRKSLSNETKFRARSK